MRYLAVGQTTSKRIRRVRRRRGAAVGIVVALGLSAGAVAWASIPDTAGVIHGCYSTSTGALRVIDTSLGQSCGTGEASLNWDQTGIRWRGGWSASATYAVNDAVSLNGSSYLAKLANTNSMPPSANWSTLAVKGATGPKGPQGIQGVQGVPGPPGPQGIIASGVAETGDGQIPGDNTIAAYGFIGFPGVVTLGSGQLTWVETDSSFYDITGVNGAYAFVSVCYRAHGTSNALTPATVDDVVRTANDGSGNIPISMTAIIGPGAGTWDVGLCDHDASPDSEFYDNNVTVFIYNSGGGAAASVRTQRATSPSVRPGLG